MNIEVFREYCLKKPGVTEAFPFGEETMTFQVLGKIFAITSLTEPDFRVNLKCNPEYAFELREQYEDIIPGFHMNKKHWNTVFFEKQVDDSLLRELIDHSYNCVVSKMPKPKQEELANLKE